MEDIEYIKKIGAGDRTNNGLWCHTNKSIGSVGLNKHIIFGGLGRDPAIISPNDTIDSTVSNASIMSATMNPTMVPLPASPEVDLRIYFDRFEDELDRVVDSAMFSKDYSTSGYKASISP